MSEMTSDQDTIPFYPDHVRSEARVTLWVTGIIFLVGIIGLFRQDLKWPSRGDLEIYDPFGFAQGNLSIYDCQTILGKAAFVNNNK